MIPTMHAPTATPTQGSRSRRSQRSWPLDGAGTRHLSSPDRARAHLHAAADGRCKLSCAVLSGQLPEECGVGLRVGDTFLGFQLVEELGQGAFARVFLARQESLAGRPVALKVTLRPTREAERLARLQHTNVVPVYSVHKCRRCR